MDADGCTCVVLRKISADVIASLSGYKRRSRRNMRVCRYGEKEACEKKACNDKHGYRSLEHSLRMTDRINEGQ